MTAPHGVSRGLLALVVVAVVGCEERPYWQTDPVSDPRAQPADVRHTVEAR